jgi:hypothetical protein
MSDQTSLAIQSDGLSGQTLDSMSWPLQRQTRREIEQVAKRAIVANVHEEARAQLCQGALINAGVLSTLEEHLIQVAPLGASRYQAIADAFVIGTCKRLMQW